MGGKGGSKTTSNTVSEPWAAAQPFLKDLLGDTQGLYESGGLDIAPWPGIRVAPQSTMTQSALQGFYDMGTQGNPITPTANTAFQDLAGGENIYNNLAGVKSQALADAMPAAMSPFASSGMLDSTFAADAAGRAATDAIAPIEYGAWSDAQNRRLSALGMAPQLAANNYLDPQMLSMAGSQQDAYQQQVLDAAQQAYSEQTNRQYDELQRAAGLGMGFGGVGGTSSGTAKEGGGGTMETIGGIMQVAGPIIAMMMSDRRTKTDIVRVGKTAEGYPKYEFRYLWDNPAKRRIGVMADEVPPDLVAELPSGIKLVNYAGVTL